MAERKHAEMSPSSFPQWELCPCYKTGEVGAAAKQGSYEHEILEKLMRGEKAFENVDKKTMEKVLWSYEAILADATRMEVRADEIMIEDQVSIMDSEMNEVTFGTLDVAFRDRLYDYKSGQMRNYRPQMEVYALGMMQARGLDKVDVGEVYGRFKQIRRYEITKADAEKAVFQTIKDISDPKKRPAKNEYCKWCKKGSTCPEVVGPVKAVVKSLCPLPAKKLNAMVKKPLADMTPEEIGAVMPLAEVVAGWAKTVIDRCKETLADNIPVPGYLLGSKAGKQYVSDLVSAQSRLEMGTDDFLECCAVSVPALAKKYKASHGKITVDAARKKTEELLGDVLARAKDSVSLVKVKDAAS